MKYEINIPETLNDIRLEQYQKFLTIENPSNEDLLCTFLDIDIEIVKQLKLDKFNQYLNQINSLFEAERKHQLKFILNGVEFGFIPDLDSITYGENKDITSYINDWETMHKAMAVLYRPIKQKQGHKYLIDFYNGTSQYSETMKQMPLGVVFGSMVFFWNLTNELLNCIPSFLEKETTKGMEASQISQENGEVIRKYTTYLKEILEDLMRLQNYRYINA